MAGGITIKNPRRPQSSRGFSPSSLSRSFYHDQQRATAGLGWSPVPQGMSSASLSPVSLSSRLSGLTTEASMMAREAAVAAREAAVAAREMKASEATEASMMAREVAVAAREAAVAAR